MRTIAVALAAVALATAPCLAEFDSCMASCTTANGGADGPCPPTDADCFSNAMSSCMTACMSHAHANLPPDAHHDDEDDTATDTHGTDGSATGDAHADKAAPSLDPPMVPPLHIVALGSSGSGSGSTTTAGAGAAVPRCAATGGGPLGLRASMDLVGTVRLMGAAKLSARGATGPVRCLLAVLPATHRPRGDIRFPVSATVRSDAAPAMRHVLVRAATGEVVALSPSDATEIDLGSISFAASTGEDQ
jgi:hypothetical protein